MHTLFLSNIVNSFFNTFTKFSFNFMSRIFKEFTYTFTKILSSSSKTSFFCSSFSTCNSTFTNSRHRCSLSLFNSSITTHILKKLNWISKSIKLNYIKYSIEIIHKESSISRLFSNLISYSFLIVSINSFKSISILLNKSSIFFIRHTIKLIKSLSFHIIVNLISLLIIFHSTHKSSIKTSFSHTLTSSHSISIVEPLSNSIKFLGFFNSLSFTCSSKSLISIATKSTKFAFRSSIEGFTSPTKSLGNTCRRNHKSKRRHNRRQITCPPTCVYKTTIKNILIGVTINRSIIFKIFLKLSKIFTNRISIIIASYSKYFTTNNIY